MKKVLLNLVFLFALVCFAGAQEFKVADIFSDNMVLQQKINNPFWGWGKPGTKVTISTSWNPDKEYTGVVNSKAVLAIPEPIKTFFPASAKQEARLIAVVVLPTPPF